MMQKFIKFFLPHCMDSFALLAYVWRNVHICFTNTSHMSRFELPFQDFSRLLDREEIWRDPTVRFLDISRSLHVPSWLFDRYLSRETGFHGEEILAIYRGAPYKKA